MGPLGTEFQWSELKGKLQSFHFISCLASVIFPKWYSNCLEEFPNIFSWEFDVLALAVKRKLTQIPSWKRTKISTHKNTGQNLGEDKRGFTYLYHEKKMCYSTCISCKLGIWTMTAPFIPKYLLMYYHISWTILLWVKIISWILHSNHQTKTR